MSHLRVGIDGVDGAGKTTFADALAEALTAVGQDVVRVSLDDFHHVRAVRHRQGRDCPVGFFEDSYDYDRFAVDVMLPFGPDGDGRYRSAAHDLATDRLLKPPWQHAPSGAVLVVDGLFLHRDELVDQWDLSVWLDVDVTTSVARMAQRDGSHPDPGHPSLHRYVIGQRLYLERCRPRERADLVIDNRHDTDGASTDEVAVVVAEVVSRRARGR